jgi:hypothetical protein
MQEEAFVPRYDAWLRIVYKGNIVFDCVHSPTFPSRQWEWTSGNTIGTCATLPELYRVASQIQDECVPDGAIVEGGYAERYNLYRSIS